MKRSSSKLISKAGSMRNINKKGYKFSFEINVELIDNINTGGTVCFTWQRGGKVLSTKPVQVNSKGVAHFSNEKLSQEITLFKRKKEGAKFEEKPFKLILRNSSPKGKIIGRLAVDFAEYVDMPSFSKRVAATLSNNSRIVMRISSNYIGEAKERQSSRGTASVGSSTLEPDNMSTSGMDDIPDEDDLDDIDIPFSTSEAPPAPMPPQASNFRRPANNPAPPPPPPTRDPPVGNTSSLRRRRPSNSSPRTSFTRSRDLPPTQEPKVAPPRRNMRSRSNDIDAGANGNTESSNEMASLRQVNRTLKRQNIDLSQRVEDLERRLQANGSAAKNEELVGKLMKENEALRDELKDTQFKLSREPEYTDVVDDLRRAKMALALLAQEKDEILQENYRLKRGR